jgi:hypothetical protein
MNEGKSRDMPVEIWAGETVNGTAYWCVPLVKDLTREVRYIRADKIPPPSDEVAGAIDAAKKQLRTGRPIDDDNLQILIHAATQSAAERVEVTEEEALDAFSKAGYIPSNVYLLFHAIKKAFPNGLKITAEHEAAQGGVGS